MNFKDLVSDYLSGNGLHRAHVTAIMQLVLEDKEFFSIMTGRWHHNVDGYPKGLGQVLCIGTHPIAYKWIQEHIPQAWFASIFAPKLRDLTGPEAKKEIDKIVEEHQRLQ